MNSPKYSEEARIHRAREFARQPWKPGKIVCPIPQTFNGGKVYSMLRTLEEQILTLMERDDPHSP